MFVDKTYGDVKSVRTHLVYDRETVYFEMQQSKHFPQIWYRRVPSDFSGFYRYTIKTKTSYWQKFKALFRENCALVEEEFDRTIPKQYGVQNQASDVTSDVFIGGIMSQIDICDIQARGCACLLIMTAESFQDTSDLRSCDKCIYQYVLHCNLSFSRYPKIALSDTLSSINSMKDPGKLYLFFCCCDIRKTHTYSRSSQYERIYKCYS